MLNKLKELSKDTAIYGISTIIGRFLGFLLVPFYTNVFSTNEFGVYAYIYAYIAFLNIVYIYGMDAAFLKYTSVAGLKEKKNLFSTPIIFVVFTSLILSIIIYVFRSPISKGMLVPSEYSYLLIYMILILIFDTVTLIPFANLRMERKATKFATIKILNIILNLILNLVLILVYNLGIEAIFISNLAASVFSFILLFPEIFRNFKPVIKKESLIQMLKFGIPYLPAALAATVVQVIDRPLLKALTDDSTVGIYQANYKLGIFMMLFVAMFQYAWQPFFLNNAKEKNAKEIFSKVLTLFVLVASVIWIVLTLFIDDIAKIEFLPGRSIIGKDYLGGLNIVPIILLAYLFHGMYINFTVGIYIKEKTKYLPLITGLGAVSNVAINLLLIPYLGIMGAALATLVSYSLMAFGIFVVSQKFYNINYEYNKLIKIFIILILTGAAFYYLLWIGLLSFYFKIIILLGFTSLLFIFEVIKRKELISALKLIGLKK